MTKLQEKKNIYIIIHTDSVLLKQLIIRIIS